MTGVLLKVKGVVQGVGFRPYMHRRSKELGLSGSVRNTAYGAEIKLFGEEDAVRSLTNELKGATGEEPFSENRTGDRGFPLLAYIEEVTEEALSDDEDAACVTGFEILPSDGSEKVSALLSPDVCTCDDCLREMFDASDRRNGYPFINCTNCGPRFSIIGSIPYDRKNTTMADFSMCGDCAREYTDISDRRYHAEPVCCDACGPRLSCASSDEIHAGEDPLRNAARAIAEGKTVAIKGIGGFHLACRADDPATVKDLRIRKHRDEKPFALMCADIDAARGTVIISDDEERLLTSPARPIVLLEKKVPGSFSYISENGRIGIMLPYAPLHFLLFKELAAVEDGLNTLVMTSANLSDRPVIFENDEARRGLEGIADVFLTHDRDIYRRVDDSVMWCVSGAPYFARRSRGYVPLPLFLEEDPAPGHGILALGAEQKATFALSSGSRVFMSQHIGDLKNIESFDNYERQIADFEKLFEISPDVLVRDAHPDYLSSAYASERSVRDALPVETVFHHHAHMASCMADNGLDGDVIGITFDGTGLGEDGTAWGGEFLTGGFSGFERRGSIRKIAMPGGDTVTKQIWRTALVLARDAGIFRGKDEREALIENILSSQVNCPETSSMGRLFDGVCAILGIRDEATYEGQGAILLEAAAETACDLVYPYDIYEENGIYIFDHRRMVRQICRQIMPGAGTDASTVTATCAATFMNTVADMSVQIAKRISKDTGLDRVVLSGGTFQNMYLLKRLPAALEKAGLKPYIHHRVSTNDEGISLGQLMIAAARRRA